MANLILDPSHLSSDYVVDRDAIEKVKEETREIRRNAGHYLENQEDLMDEAAARGTPLPYQELIAKLEKLNPRLLFRDGGYPGAIACYTPVVTEDGLQGLKYVTGFMKSVLPEHSTVEVDEDGCPTKENRGWRSVVLALAKQRLISKKDADSVFGPALGQMSRRWDMQIQDKGLNS